MLDGEPLTGAPEARLDLVDDQQGAVFIKDLLDPPEVFRRRGDDPAVALDRLGDQGGHLTGGGGLDHPGHRLGAGQVAGRVVEVQRAAVAVGVRHEGDPPGGVGVGAPHAQTGEAHAEVGAPAQTVLQGQQFAAAGGHPGQQDRPIVGLAAAVAEEALLQPARGDPGQPLCQFHDRLGQVDVADVLQGLYLVADPGSDLRVAVAGVDDRNAREEVQVLPAVAVIQVLAPPPHELYRLLIEVIQAGHDIFLFLEKDLLWSHETFWHC